jgi:arylsulfatase
MLPAAAYVSQFLATFKDFPPRQRPASFSIDQVLQSLQLDRAN